jgi:dCMP deaminase
MKDIFIKTALLLSQKSKCVSKKVGAVIVKDNRIISMGYNGCVPGFKNCNEVFDENNFIREEHHKWSDKYEIHAEMNLILFSAKNDINISSCDMYVTLHPCDQCIKNLVQSGIKKIYYVYEYDKRTKDNELLSRIEIEKLKTDDIENFIKINNLKKLY